MPADAVLPCGPRRSNPHIPCRELLRSSPWQRSRCSPPWDRCSSPECFLHKSPRRHRCRCRQTRQRPCRWRIRMQQQCSRRRGHRVASKWAISRTNRDIHIIRCRHWGMASSSRSSTSRDISSHTSRYHSSSTTPGPSRCLRSLTNSGLKVFNSKCRRCRVLNNQQLK